MEFCSCGSIVINEHCTNKNCTVKSAKSSTVKAKKKKKDGTEEVAPKKTRAKRASKVVTYELENPEEIEKAN